MRADRATQHTWDMSERAALMKACLLRKHRRSGTSFEGEEGEITVALNRENDNVGYLLGRLFAVMERAQEGALRSINATVRDKYMGTAAVTPNRVYPTLMGMCQKHLGALRRETSTTGLARMLEREFDSIFSMLPGADDAIPASMSVDDQMRFYIGYYQQRADLWTSRKDKRQSDNNASNA
jgi:CRISPR-associated protein Csd1